MEHELKKKTVRDESLALDEETNSAEVKRLKKDLLETLEDDQDFVSWNLDLDACMMSFQDEIGGSPPPEVVDLTSDPGESQPELGYLLEASDDELGLPPSTASPSGVENDGLTELVRVDDSYELGHGFWGFDGETPSYSSFDFGLVESENYNISNNSEYAALDGLFDY